MFPLEVRARSQPLLVPSIDIEDPGLAVAQGDTGYVDIQSDEPGDRFVDEDGDGLDDRHLEWHQKRNRQGWRNNDWNGSGSENGNNEFGGQKGHGVSPGKGGR